MDVFYEESAIDKNSAKSKQKYKIVHTISVIVLIVAALFLMFFVLNMPWGGSGEAIEAMRAMAIFCGVQGAFLLAVWFFLYKWKSRFNVSFDYVFVSGELRVSKVFNGNRRKLIVRIDCEDMLQVGDVDNPSYERFKSDPKVKEMICTPNGEPDEGKFFMYVLASYNGKTLFVLECRENLLMNIMKFARRTILESDYVMQEKKQK